MVNSVKNYIPSFIRLLICYDMFFIFSLKTADVNTIPTEKDKTGSVPYSNVGPNVAKTQGNN